MSGGKGRSGLVGGGVGGSGSAGFCGGRGREEREKGGCEFFSCEMYVRGLIYVCMYVCDGCANQVI